MHDVKRCAGAPGTSTPGRPSLKPGLRRVSDRRLFLLRDGELVVGRQESSDIVLEEAGLSRRHARLEVSGVKVALTDLQSLNGTLLNGEEVHSTRPLRNGDEIVFDAETYEFRLLLPNADDTANTGETNSPNKDNDWQSQELCAIAAIGGPEARDRQQSGAPLASTRTRARLNCVRRWLHTRFWGHERQRLLVTFFGGAVVTLAIVQLLNAPH